MESRRRGRPSTQGIKKPIHLFRGLFILAAYNTACPEVLDNESALEVAALKWEEWSGKSISVDTVKKHLQELMPEKSEDGLVITFSKVYSDHPLNFSSGQQLQSLEFTIGPRPKYPHPSNRRNALN